MGWDPETNMYQTEYSRRLFQSAPDMESESCNSNQLVVMVKKKLR